MKNTLKYFGLLFSMLMLLSACEKMNFDESSNEKEEVKDGVQVQFNVTQFEQIPFNDGVTTTKASVEVSKICTQISLAVFSNSEKLKLINQESTDKDFGTFSLVLAKGDYTVVILAHNGLGSATITSPEEIKFADNKVTDTFYFCQDISVTDTHTYDVMLKRAVAKFRLIIEDNMPDSVKTMQFKYTGGSSTFDARTGYGCVNSRQTETREVTPSMIGKPSQFEIYSFPHTEDDQLKITVAALGVGDVELYSRVFEEVPITRNVVTQYKGKFFESFSGGDSGNVQTITMSLNTDSTWMEVTHLY